MDRFRAEGARWEDMLMLVRIAKRGDGGEQWETVFL
jgi:hypothetical protein